MSNTFLTEAFQALSLLKEETFDVTRDDLSALRDFLDVEDDTVEIIDTEADTVDDLKDTYIGKVILECPVCTSMVYKDKDAIELNDELAVANEDEECPYCHTAGGFKIIGEVSEFNPHAEVEEETEEEVEDIPETEEIEETEETKDEIIEEALEEKKSPKSLYELIYGTEAPVTEELEEEDLEESTTTDLVVDRRETSIDASDGEKPMREGLGDVKIELDGKEIKVKEDEIKIKELAPEIDEESTEVITPIESEAEFVDTITADEEEDDDYIDLDVEEIDEKSFDDLIESYLLKTFDNVKNYNTTRGYIDGNKIMMEGHITYTSGKKLSTVFTFESKYAKDGHHVIFEGKNKHLTEAFDTCELSGRIKDKKLLPRTFKPLQ